MASAKPGLILGALAAVAAMCGRPAVAEVIEIGRDGSVARYTTPSIFTDAGAMPISPKAPSTVAAQPVVIQAIGEAATRQALSPSLLEAMAWRESALRPNAISPKGAFGVMQLMPQTAAGLGVDRFDLRQNIHGGAAYMRQMLDRYHGDLVLGLAAYNAGPGAVDRYRGVPPFPETQAYVGAIMSRLAEQASITNQP